MNTKFTAAKFLTGLFKAILIAGFGVIIYILFFQQKAPDVQPSNEPNNLISSDLTIEQGVKGEKGEQGEPGIPGKDGIATTNIVYTNSQTDNFTFEHWDSNNCADGQIPKFNAIDAKWECANDARGGSGGSTTNNYYTGGGVFVGMSAGSYNGNIVDGADNGYVAANNICSNEYSDSHFCQTHEILNTINTEDISGFSGTAWIVEGPPGYLADANDCMGFTDNSPTVLGSFWEFISSNGGRGWLVNCSVSKPIACCR